MNHDYIVRMANQIGDALGINPDREQAVRDLADHLTRFWEPRMRKALFEALDGSAGRQLSPLVLDATARMRRPA
ncbi:formate dehydrogenase subunit delta [Zoogloea sp.]|uniref:formate dehydrogenase subunit delta n=1 Tax=Zoogloea sp. TaxID=49181 RepID=UPI0014157C98|nr:MAG: formate dehydrogenase subunit delta [Zoogloea sp.]